jgi:hypothetical protein
LAVILSAGPAYAEGYDKPAMGNPPSNYKLYNGPRSSVDDNTGMESVKVGSTTVLVPDGMKIYQSDAQIILEETDAYMGRKFRDLESELKKVKKDLQDLKKEVDELKNE